jgi:hypothetical protein
MAEKLYAVTEGIYSDYHIVALCSDKSRAELIAKCCGGHVEEYNDGARIDLNQLLFEVLLDENGECENVLECDDVTKMDTLFNSGYDYRWKINIAGGGKYSTFVSTNNVYLAIKIARDRLAQYKAEREGIT